MTATLKFHLPSDCDPDAFMEHIWKQGTMSHLMFVRRMSLRGNPHIKGLFIFNDDATIPSDFECTPISEDCASLSVREFQEEISMENNGVELGAVNHWSR